MSKGEAVTLPGVGIILNPADLTNIDLLRHEFGHTIQAKDMGSFLYFIQIGFPSLYSATRESFDSDWSHRNYSTETDANDRSYYYFNQPKNWNRYFPLKPSYNQNPIHPYTVPVNVYSPLFIL